MDAKYNLLGKKEKLGSPCLTFSKISHSLHWKDKQAEIWLSMFMDEKQGLLFFYLKNICNNNTFYEGQNKC